MRGRSYTPSPPRGYGRRGRSPSPRGRYGGGGGSRDRDLPTSLLVRNLRHDCRQEDLRRPFEQFGPLKDIYLPRDYYTGDPRGFGFIQYVDPADAAEAKHHLDGFLLLGRELTVVFAEENRKKPTEMRTRDRGGDRGGSRSNRFNDRRRSPPRYSRSPPPRRGGRTRSRSRDYNNSPPPKRHISRSVSPQDRRFEKERSYSRSPPRNGSRVRSGSPVRVKSVSRSRSPRRSVSPRRNRSYTPEQARSRSPVPRQSRSRSPIPMQSRSRSPIPRSPSQ